MYFNSFQRVSHTHTIELKFYVLPGTTVMDALTVSQTSHVLPSISESLSQRLPFLLAVLLKLPGVSSGPSFSLCPKNIFTANIQGCSTLPPHLFMFPHTHFWSPACLFVSSCPYIRNLPSIFVDAHPPTFRFSLAFKVLGSQYIFWFHSWKGFLFLF